MTTETIIGFLRNMSEVPIITSTKIKNGTTITWHSFDTNDLEYYFSWKNSYYFIDWLVKNRNIKSEPLLQEYDFYILSKEDVEVLKNVCQKIVLYTLKMLNRSTKNFISYCNNLNNRNKQLPQNIKDYLIKEFSLDTETISFNNYFIIDMIKTSAKLEILLSHSIEKDIFICYTI